MDRPLEYEVYIKSSQWKNICTMKKKQVGNICERCGYGSARLEVHHLTYERFKKERLDDLLVVCKPCHEKEEIKRKAELEKKAKKALYNARFEGYMKAKHGEDYLFYEEPTDEDYEEFDEWLEKKQENDLGELL